MADMYGALRSNFFKVKDVEKFKEWFAKYHFGDDVEVWVENETERSVGFGSYGMYPFAHPRIRDEEEDELVDADLNVFAKELCEHLEAGEVFSVTSGGNEKLRYVSYDQLIIAQEHPDQPLYEYRSSQDDNDVLLKRVRGE